MMQFLLKGKTNEKNQAKHLDTPIPQPPSEQLSPLSIHDIDKIPPMSENILDHILGRGRAIDLLEGPNEAKKNALESSHGFSKMDSFAHYWDGSGLLWRSATVTNRMLARGVKLPLAQDPALGLPRGDVLDHTIALPEPPFLQFKNNKIAKIDAAEDTKHRKITRANAEILRSLEAVYGPPTKNDKIVLTESAHTLKTPSRNLRYIDEDGNIRAMKREQCDTPLVAPPPTPVIENEMKDAEVPVVAEPTDHKKVKAGRFWSKTGKPKETKAKEVIEVKAEKEVVPTGENNADEPNNKPDEIVAAKPTSGGWKLKFGAKHSNKPKEHSVDTVQPPMNAGDASELTSTQKEPTSTEDEVKTTPDTDTELPSAKNDSDPSGGAEETASKSKGIPVAKSGSSGWKIKFRASNSLKDKEPVTDATTTANSTETTATPPTNAKEQDVPECEMVTAPQSVSEVTPKNDTAVPPAKVDHEQENTVPTETGLTTMLTKKDDAFFSPQHIHISIALKNLREKVKNKEKEPVNDTLNNTESSPPPSAGPNNHVEPESEVVKVSPTINKLTPEQENTKPAKNGDSLFSKLLSKKGDKVTSPAAKTQDVKDATNYDSSTTKDMQDIVLEPNDKIVIIELNPTNQDPPTKSNELIVGERVDELAKDAPTKNPVKASKSRLRNPFKSHKSVK